MIYGKRVIESHQWLYRKGPFKAIRIVDKTFQWKYTLYLTSALAGSAFLFLGPAWYFVNQNYEIFIRLADRTDPALYENFQRESTWLLGFLILAGLSILGLCLGLGLKLTESIIGPLISLERHMQKVTRGDLSQRDFHIRVTDDFKSLAHTYSYLYKSLKAQTEQDLKWLEKIVIDPHNRDAMAAWQALVKTKQSQLGLAKKSKPKLVNETAAPSAEAPVSRRVS